MTPSQRRLLIEKRQQGTLTEEENQQYLELMRTDSSFYDDVEMHAVLTEVVREDTDQSMWEAVGKARDKARRRSPVLVSVWRHPYAYAMAACLAVLLVGAWVSGFFNSSPSTPQLVKVEADYLFRADAGRPSDSSKGYAGGDMPIGKLPLKWIRDEQTTATAAYRYCQDTLTIFIRNDRDTLYLQDARLRYDPVTGSLSVERPNQILTIFRKCTSNPQPF
ncbi:hypothetical protein [Spirosoma endophyticum]|uniref:Uncharacterized protein n=1 Tax=Spirosoma endophyticum TaxID=662367 RepID=A0A1I2GER0_9BACT|nr:hypothetical protein [Spirosoma endophyticum]SFF16274.1 hypothetical protein SAMN05216167_13210 [Spirosoma endophyticum]